MQATRIIGLIKGEIDFTEDTLYSLKNVLQEYPYFQTAQLLYTLNLQVAKDSRFNAELRKAACLVGDRRNLFYRIKSDSFPVEWIEKLERQDESASGSSFDLINIFLAEQEKKEYQPAPKPVSSEEISTDYLSYVRSKTPDDTNTEKVPLQHQDIIDLFLEKDKKSPAKITLKGQPEEDANILFPDLDTVEEGSLFSETLAKIYIKQKKYEKALEIIRKLYLCNPEKNRYFADQIRFLEKLVINTKK